MFNLNQQIKSWGIPDPKQDNYKDCISGLTDLVKDYVLQHLNQKVEVEFFNQKEFNENEINDDILQAVFADGSTYLALYWKGQQAKCITPSCQPWH